jgi:hypothetical protein
VAQLSAQQLRNDDGILFLDAGITRWNTRPRMSQDHAYLDTVHPSGIKLVPPLSYAQQAKYKYMVHISGHSAAYRLSRELASGSVVLLVKGTYTLWFMDWLHPFVHYIPVKKDCSDLLDRIRWCQTHDDECESIARQALEFANTYLTEDGILSFLQSTLVRVKQRTGTYKTRIPSIVEQTHTTEEVWMRHDRECCMRSLPVTGTTTTVMEKLGAHTMSLELMMAVRWTLVVDDTFLLQYRAQPVRTNHNSVLESLQIGNVHLLRKTPVSSHEAFVGLHTCNKAAQWMPNFAFTYGVFHGALYTQYFPKAFTFFEYLQSPQLFSMQGYLNTLYHVAFVLHEAQSRYGFVHWDLTPWNVLLDPLRQPMSLQYLYRDTQCMVIETTLNPILIDYEKSHVVDVNTGWHHGNVQPLTMDFVQDVLTLLVSSLSVVVAQQTLSKRDLAVVLKLASFFGGTGFGKYTHFKTLSQLRTFLNEARKYEYLVTAPKGCELRGKTALDFIFFLTAHFEFTSSTTPFKTPLPQNALQVYCALTNTPNPMEEWMGACGSDDVDGLDLLTLLRMYNRLRRACPDHALLGYLQEKIDKPATTPMPMTRSGWNKFWVGAEVLGAWDALVHDMDAAVVSVKKCTRNWNELKMEVQWYMSHFDNCRYQVRRWSSVLSLPSTDMLTWFANSQTMATLLERDNDKTQ